MAWPTENMPLVGVVMGSETDSPVMEAAVEVLHDFRIAHEVAVVSAHRGPDKMIKYGHEAVDRGLEVIIAGAGGSAALPGMLAATTRIPVLGVSVNVKNKPLQAGMASQVEMPKGAPLFYMGENESGAANAGYGAVRILANGDEDLAARYDAHVGSFDQLIEDMNERVQLRVLDLYSRKTE